MNRQRFEDALKLFDQAHALAPELFPAQLNRGIALLSLQQYELARETLLEASRTNPENPRAWYNLGLLHKNLGQAEAGLAAFTHVAQLDPSDADTRYFLGLLYGQLQQYQTAITAYQQAVALNPFHVSAEFGLARAYQRTGDAARARHHLERFQRLVQERLGVPMSLVYGDQGRYSLAEEITPGPGSVPPAIRVRFLPVTAQAGLRFQHGRGLTATPATRPPAPKPGTVASFLGSGACFLDYDGDGRTDLFLVNSGPHAVSALYRNAGEGRFVEATSQAQLEALGYGLGCTAGDYDNDGRTDLAVSFFGRVALFRNQEGGTFRDVTEAAGIRVEGFPLGLSFVDFDHDGDLDLYVTRFVNFPGRRSRQPFKFPFEPGPSPNLLWRNNGNSTFTDWTQPSGLGGTAPSVAVVGTDLNNDRAVDLVLTGWSRVPALLVNPREGSFRALQQPWAAPMPAPTAGVVALDFNKDGWMDLAFTHWGPPGVSLWRNAEGNSFEPVKLPGEGWRRGWGLSALDYDNDGWVDLAAAGETADGAQLRLLRNLGQQGFQDTTALVGLAALKLRHPRAVITADYDDDGDTDLLVTENQGPLHLLRNEGGNQNNWLRVALKGLTDNKSAIGTKVEVFAGALWQKWEVQAASGYLGQSALEVTAGLGSQREAEIVRLLWPTGVLQDEVQLAAAAIHRVSEIDRRGSSCPILFAWNGNRFEFIADVMGAGIVGHWVGPGERNVSDPTEYVKVSGLSLQPRQGRLSFRLIEPMEEVVYLDQVRLLVVDSPVGVDVNPNEYFAGSPPFPSFKVILSREARPPLGAWDDRGRDVLGDLLHRDRRYVTGFALLPFKGLAEPHSLELDLGEWDPSRPLRLLLHGFIDYFTATSVFAAHQAGLRPLPPFVEALDAKGRWVRVVDNLGFPAGLARTMVADLTRQLPPSTRRIRLVTNLQIYWDQVLVDTTSESLPRRLTEVPLVEATLGFYGYPRPVEGNPRGDLTYVYEDVSLTGPYALHAGSYTRYGDVLSLLAAAENQFVIFGSGEEVSLEFDSAALPAVPPGWARTYLFFGDGFAKDMDFYEAYSQTVEPLPFHGMGRYPYPARPGYPQEEIYLDYLFIYNSRHVSGKPPATFRFAYGAGTTRGNTPPH